MSLCRFQSLKARGTSAKVTIQGFWGLGFREVKLWVDRHVLCLPASTDSDRTYGHPTP